MVRCGYHQSGSDTVGTRAGINARNVSNFGTVAVVVVYLCVRAVCLYWGSSVLYHASGGSSRAPWERRAELGLDGIR